MFPEHISECMKQKHCGKHAEVLVVSKPAVGPGSEGGWQHPWLYWQEHGLLTEENWSREMINPFTQGSLDHIYMITYSLGTAGTRHWSTGLSSVEVTEMVGVWSTRPVQGGWGNWACSAWTRLQGEKDINYVRKGSSPAKQRTGDNSRWGNLNNTLPWLLWAIPGESSAQWKTEEQAREPQQPPQRKRGLSQRMGQWGGSPAQLWDWEGMRGREEHHGIEGMLREGNKGRER